MNTDLVTMWQDIMTGETFEGLLVNTAWCPVTGKWNLLIAGFDGTFKQIASDTLGLQVYPGFAMESSDGE